MKTPLGTTSTSVNGQSKTLVAALLVASLPFVACERDTSEYSETLHSAVVRLEQLAERLPEIREAMDSDDYAYSMAACSSALDIARRIVDYPFDLLTPAEVIDLCEFEEPLARAIHYYRVAQTDSNQRVWCPKSIEAISDVAERFHENDAFRELEGPLREYCEGGGPIFRIRTVVMYWWDTPGQPTAQVCENVAQEFELIGADLAAEATVQHYREVFEQGCAGLLP